MAILLQSGTSFHASPTTTVTFASSTVGSLILAYVGTTTTGTTCSASDNVNGAYTTDTTGTLSGIALCSFPNNAGGALTISGTMTGGGTVNLIAEEWGGQLPSPFDKTNHASAGSVTTIAIPATPTLTQSNELCVAMCQLSVASGGSFAVAATFTASPASPAGATTGVLAAGYQIVTATTGVGATFNWTSAANARAIVGTYKIGVVQSPPIGAFIAVLP